MLPDYMLLHIRYALINNKEPAEIYLKLFLGSFIILLLASCSSQSIDKNKVDTLISQINENYAPDSRTTLFDIDYSVEGDTLILTGETTNSDAIKHLMMRFSVQNIPAINDVTILPEKKLGDEVIGLVNNSVANIRSRPSHTSQLTTQATLGTNVTIYKEHESGEWYYIQTPDKYLGWVDKAGLVKMDSANYQDWRRSDKVIFTSPQGAVYEEPNQSSYPVSDLTTGSLLKTSGAQSNDFLQVSYPDDRSGYVPKNKVTDYDKWLNESSNPSAMDLISTARQYKGFPYMWGGTSSKAFDCSGFTQTIFFMHGIQIPRDASQQINVGDTVNTGHSYQGAEAGDLLFFGEEKGKITHVALYMGNNEIIHASGKVKIESLSPSDDHYNEYRDTTFQSARRILGNQGTNNIQILKKTKEN